MIRSFHGLDIVSNSELPALAQEQAHTRPIDITEPESRPTICLVCKREILIDQGKQLELRQRTKTAGEANCISKVLQLRFLPFVYSC